MTTPHVAGIDRARAPRVRANLTPPSSVRACLRFGGTRAPCASDPERFLRTKRPLTFLFIMRIEHKLSEKMSLFSSFQEDYKAALALERSAKKKRKRSSAA